MTQRSERMLRRDWLRLTATGLTAFGTAIDWHKSIIAAEAGNRASRRSCILLWMNGGPSQTDTFDMKPDHHNGGEFSPISTITPGLQISEHLSQMSKQTNHLAVIRSMVSKEGDHGRASHLLHTGYAPQSSLSFPTLGSLVTKELPNHNIELPNFVSIRPFRHFNRAAHSPGFLGHEYASFLVGESSSGKVLSPKMPGYNEALHIDNLQPKDNSTVDRENARVGLLSKLDDHFLREHPVGSSMAHRTAIERGIRLMRSTGVKAFDLEAETPRVRDAYGQNLFGQACLLARRLIERGVTFVEVTLDSVPGVPSTGWDTHEQNFDRCKRLSHILDTGWATLLFDLHQRGLLETTTVVWMGEFGRTPMINKNAGRDHAPNGWTTVLAGGGIRGGQVIGRTSKDGTTVEDRPVSVPDLFATICLALEIDPRKENMSNLGRQVRIADSKAVPISEVLL